MSHSGWPAEEPPSIPSAHGPLLLVAFGLLGALLAVGLVLVYLLI
jgi:hypothetical protein